MRRGSSALTCSFLAQCQRHGDVFCIDNSTLPDRRTDGWLLWAVILLSLDTLPRARHPVRAIHSNPEFRRQHHLACVRSKHFTSIASWSSYALLLASARCFHRNFNPYNVFRSLFLLFRGMQLLRQPNNGSNNEKRDIKSRAEEENEPTHDTEKKNLIPVIIGGGEKATGRPSKRRMVCVEEDPRTVDVL